MKINKKPSLTEFLKNEGVYEKFCKGVKQFQPHATPDEYLEEFKGFSEGIRAAFPWNKMEEGEDFWETVDDKWHEIYPIGEAWKMAKIMEKKANQLKQKYTEDSKKNHEYLQLDPDIIEGEFNSLLQKYGAVEKFEEYVKKYHNQSVEEYLEEICNKGEGPRDFLNNLATWNELPEGGRYWSSIDDEWEDTLYRLIGEERHSFEDMLKKLLNEKLGGE